MKIVLDTNVLFQAIYSDKGASHKILSLIRSGDLTLLISTTVITEYEEVLKRNIGELNLNKENIEDLLVYFGYIGKRVIPHYLWRPNLQDEDDNIFVELALNGNADWLITQNISDFRNNAELRFYDLKIDTPSNFQKYWRKKNEK
ncbi:MAG: putative toxin-antitoxin system toxin component, PIN family [bacterium]